MLPLLAGILEQEERFPRKTSSFFSRVLALLCWRVLSQPWAQLSQFPA